MTQVKARSIVAVAIKSKKLIRPTVCSKCGISCNPMAHHKDYDKPLDVEWLCRKCHIENHREKGAGLNCEEEKCNLSPDRKRYLTKCKCKTLTFSKNRYPEFVIIANKLAKMDGRSAHSAVKILVVGLYSAIKESKLPIYKFVQIISEIEINPRLRKLKGDAK